MSLVPSITETLFALGRGEALVGCTLYCIEPRDALAGATRVGGEKNPDLDRIRALHPDLVLANVEENLREHVETLRGWGVAVFVSYPRTVEAGIRLIRDLGEITGAGAAGAALADSLARALAALSERLTGQPRPRVFYPIWRRPWMTVNRDTYVHDMLAVCGADNVFAALPARYPEIGLDEVAAARPDVILLPDEPYRFRRPHIADFALYPEVPAVRDGRIHLVDGKLAAWYGPRIGEALDVLPGLLGRG